MLPRSVVAVPQSNYRLYSTVLSLRVRLTHFFFLAKRAPVGRAGGCPVRRAPVLGLRARLSRSLRETPLSFRGSYFSQSFGTAHSILET